MRRINKRLLVYITGIVLMTEAVFMLSCIPVSLIYGGKDLAAFLFSALITGGIGLFFFFSVRKNVRKEPSIRDAFIFTSLTWILISVFGALPYIFSGSLPGFIDAYFEAVSGFTTTGSSVYTDIEIQPRGIIYWRSLTHWMGGIGVIVMVIVILPTLKAGGVHLYSAETTRANFGDLRPRIIDTIKSFGIVYLVLTFSEVILLLFGGMPLYDSLCHSYGTIATGGFGTKNASIGGYSPYIQYVVAIFMFLAATNFTLHFLIGKGRFKDVFRNEEFRTYLAIVSGFTLVITFILLPTGRTIEQAFRDSFFQVASIVSCTGFATSDYLLWPAAGWFLIFLAMFSGGSAGSTSGGIKVVRHLLMFKNMAVNIRSLLHPKVIYAVKYQGNVLSGDHLRSVIAFYFWYLVIFFASSLLMMAIGVDFFSSIGGVATTMGGIGPGLGTVGPAGNFHHIPDLGKILLTFTMIIGRLELYSFLVLFSPAFWRS